ncbi:MAG: SCO family protein [Gemmatimonadota bacterium]|nr:SCO family protein [Gemmatimonadota bacterium]
MTDSIAGPRETPPSARRGRPRPALLWASTALLVALAAAGGLVVGRAGAGDAGALHGSLIEPPMPVPEFTLASGDGPVSSADLRGTVTVLFFGYTFCPDICPFTLQRLRQARELLGPAGDGVRVVFVSVDPERDTPERATAYARGFDPSFTGLSGSPQAIADVASSFGIFFARAAPQEDTDGGNAAGGDRAGGDDDFYLVDHSATILALDRDGRLRLIWGGPATAEEMAADLRFLLSD